MTRMAYDRCLKEMFSLHRFGIKLEMDTIQHMLLGLGNPHLTYQCIHIAGTNGKGSVAAMLSHIFQAAGLRVGRYTSPHLVRFNERICIDNIPIKDSEVVNAYEKVTSLAPPQRHPTFFEFTTAMALYEFARQKVQWAIIETGMGGRLDATNTILPKISIITNISLEHKAYLGRTLTAIAGEKAGIIKPGTPTLSGVRQKAASDTIKKTADRMKAPLYRLGSDFCVRRHKGQLFTYKGLETTWRQLSLNLLGDHQISNAGLALAACEVLRIRQGAPIHDTAIRSGLARVTWPGRLEMVSCSPLIILDGAHNLMAARLLAKFLQQNLNDYRITLIIGVLDDKPYQRILQDLAPCCDRMIITQPVIDRAVQADVLAKEALKSGRKVEIISSVGQAVQHALRTIGEKDAICIAGSLYVIGEAKTALTELGVHPIKG